ncbi:CAP domain-containing protein [Deinococcus puniceus]|uniref:SCP domain-containing protein n=1 Tax=Deinococcus puniceus TaxID=1182568 RepID=A0A172T793_9DEIO|nr:CAP domain-containing protein [Deinococcus puniceus]ANE42861.1 hypothetical protein SU48_02755 [Deinococcus puniceus]
MSAFLRLPAALLALCAVLTACPGSTPPPSGVRVDVTDFDTKQDFTYVSNNFQAARAPLSVAPRSTAEAKMLEAVNTERARGGVCPTSGGGTVAFPVRAPLIFEGHLHAAATGHAAHIVTSQTSTTLSHIGENGSTPARRMVEAGYTPLPTSGTKAVFLESIALGIDDPTEVIAAWKTSVRHCAALFDGATDGSAARGQRGQTVAWVLDVGGVVVK